MRTFAVLGASLCALALACTAGTAAAATASTSPSVTIADHTFDVEVATTMAEREHGLMDRTSMPANHGMLFVFSQAEPLTFWMKNTLIPLDMLFFNSQRRIVSIQADAVPCKADPCKLYPSNVPARYVLELNAGTAAKLGLRVGDTATFSNVQSGTSATQ
ncbi:MAG TPA: DUF192 domain-containing protein [Rhodanobacteraceae bacterium]